MKEQKSDDAITNKVLKAKKKKFKPPRSKDPAIEGPDDAIKKVLKAKKKKKLKPPLSKDPAPASPLRKKKKNLKRKAPPANGEAVNGEAVTEEAVNGEADNEKAVNGEAVTEEAVNGAGEEEGGEEGEDDSGTRGGGTAARAFQRVKVEEVKFKDPRLQDNSYWAKSGADSGWGAKAQEVLGRVRGKDFRHEKTKKKRGSYRGGSIDLQSHSIKFANSDDE